MVIAESMFIKLKEDEKDKMTRNANKGKKKKNAAKKISYAIFCCTCQNIMHNII